MFVHTQVPAVLLGPWMRRVPTVVSIDATPEQYDELGEFYAHVRGPALVERFKHRMNRRCFERAAHLVTWSEWARQGLVRKYGIHPDRITVIPPGVDIRQWRPEPSPASDGPVRVLFVGADLKRKGGDVLIEAVRRLRDDPTVPDIELHLVTNASVAACPGVVLHAGLSPNSSELIAQYRAADIFCLPTLGDCLPMVLAEAAATGLPIVSTDVGAIREIVRPDETGTLVPPGDIDALVGALRQLVADPELRRRYGQASGELANRDHDARANAMRIVQLLRSFADRSVD
jgi:glycosyltransferase involved in cell wall biosynthesis